MTCACLNAFLNAYCISDHLIRTYALFGLGYAFESPGKTSTSTKSDDYLFAEL